MCVHARVCQHLRACVCVLARACASPRDACARLRMMRVRAPQTLETLNAIFTVLFAAELLVNAFAHWFRDFVLNFWSMVRRRARRRALCSRPLAETAEHTS